MKRNEKTAVKELNQTIGIFKQTLDAAKSMYGLPSIKTVEDAKEHYRKLYSQGIKYGELALEVIENSGKFGQISNIHLKAQSKFEGIRDEDYDAVREKIIIELGRHDKDMRTGGDNPNGTVILEKIEAYHIKVFKSLSTPYAWGGLAMKELVGSGSWMAAYTGEQSYWSIIEAVFRSGKIHESREYSNDRMIASVRHSLSAYNPFFIIEKPFAPMIQGGSKEYVAMSWKIDLSRVQEVSEKERTPDSALVVSKVFQILPATSYKKLDDSVSDSGEENVEIASMSANEVIASKIAKLQSISEEERLDAMLNSALDDLDFAEPDTLRVVNSNIQSVSEARKLAGEILSSTPLQSYSIASTSNTQAQSQSQDEQFDTQSWLEDVLRPTDGLFTGLQGMNSSPFSRSSNDQNLNQENTAFFNAGSNFQGLNELMAQQTEMMKQIFGRTTFEQNDDETL